MSYHKPVDLITRQWRANRAQVDLELRALFAEVRDNLLQELDEQFSTNVNIGKIQELRVPQEKIRQLLVKQANQLSKSA